MKKAILPAAALAAAGYSFLSAQPACAVLPAVDPAVLICLIIPALYFAAKTGGRDD